MDGESGTRRPSSVVTSGQKEMERPRRCRLAASASTSACRCSARPAEKARQETPDPCSFDLSTRCTSCVFFAGGDDDASGGVVLMVVVDSVLPFREETASSSLSESLSCRYF